MVCQHQYPDLLIVMQAFMTGARSQAGDADYFQAPGLTSGFHGPWMSTLVYCPVVSATVTMNQFFSILQLNIIKNFSKNSD